MALVNFKKGLLASLPSTYAEGTFYVTTDEPGLYLDISDSQRVRFGDFQEFDNLTALKANSNPSTTVLYYVKDINCLAKWNGTEYIQINRDTGMTSIEVVGEGNVITAASYDEATRKLTLTKGITAATPAVVDEKITAKTGELVYNDTTYETVKAYVDAKTSGIATDAALSDLTNRVTDAEKGIDALEEAIGEGGSVSQQIDDKIAALDLPNTYEGKGAAAEEAGKVQDVLDEYIEANDAAVKAAADAAAEAKGEADKKVASVAAGDNSVTVAGTATAPTVAVKLSADADNAMTLADDGLKVVIPAAAEYSIVKAENSGDFAAVYNLTKDGIVVGASINIPKDMVVESGSVVENPEGQAAGTYIKLVLQNVAEPLYINVGNLIEYVTSGSATGDMVVINVSDDHKVTATITDGSITLAKLSTEIQTAIGKAHAHENADVLNGITVDKVAAWDAAEQNAKDYADGLNTAMNTRVKAIEDDYLKAADKKELSDAVAAEAERADAAEKANAAAAKAAQDDVNALAAKVGEIAADTTVVEMITTSATTAETNAKTYVDEQLEAATAWGSF